MNHELAQFRAQIDDFLEHHPQSPLDPVQRSNFEELDYFDENDALVLDVEVVRFADNEPLIEMETSTGDRRMYRRWGRFGFEVEGVSAEITIYSDPHGHDFFMPFKDSTNGKESYGAGRYMDNHRPGLTQLSETHFAVDFNYAYNPYCAYNAGYSCPLPPHENWLKLPVRAGEKKFK